MATGREKEGELETTSLEFDDISNEITTLGACFSMFVCIPDLHSFPLRTNWRKSDTSVDGEPQGNWRWNSNSRDVVASSPSFTVWVVLPVNLTWGTLP